MALSPGWYHAAGDPPELLRYWDGDKFTDETAHNALARGQRARMAQTWRLAGPTARIGAWAIDNVVPIALFVAVALIRDSPLPTVDDVQQPEELWNTYLPIIALYAVFHLVNQVAFVAIHGRTLGKSLIGVRVVRHNDEERPPGLVSAVVRYVVSTVGLLLAPVNALLFFYGKRRLLHDLAANTSVIYE